MKWNLIIRIVLWVLILKVPDIYSQPSFLPNNPQFETFSVRDGLTNSGVLCFEQDKTGFMWIGTEDGLNRFDGYHFKGFQYDPEDSLSLSHSLILSLAVSPSNQVWVGTAGGLCYYNEKKQNFIRIHLPFLYPKTIEHSYNITHLAFDALGILWVLTPFQLFSISPQLEIHSYTLPEIRYFNGSPFVNIIDKNNSSRFTFDINGNLWLSMGFSGVYKFNVTTKQFSKLDIPFDYNFAESITIDKKGYLWVICGKVSQYTLSDLSSSIEKVSSNESTLLKIGVIELDDRDTVSFLNVVDRYSKGEVWNIFISNKGFVLVSLITPELSTGFFAYDATTYSKTEYSRDPKSIKSLSDNFITCFFEDRSGVFWAGSYTFGLNLFSTYRQKFRLYQHDPSNPNSLNNNYVRGILKDNKGYVWVATQFGGINRFSPDRKQVKQYYIKGKIGAWDFLQDHRGEIWASGVGESSLYRYNSLTDSFDEFPLNIPLQATLNIFEDSNHQIYVGCRSMAVISPDRKSIKTLFKPDSLPILTFFSIQSIFEDNNGKIWVSGTESGYIYDPKLNTIESMDTVLNQKLGGLNFLISSISSSSPDTIRLTTKGAGILFMSPKGEIIGQLTKHDGLPHSNCYAILDDDNGNWWISTDAGVCMYSPSQKTFEYYTPDDGLQSTEFNRLSYYKASDGEMFFGGINGFNSFYPSDIRKNPYSPRVAVTNIFSGIENYYSDYLNNNILRIQYSDNPITIEFAGLDFHAPQKNRFRYRIDGARRWLEVGNNPSITLAKLSPGLHTISVTGSNNDGHWNDEEILTLSIEIIPPFYLSRWFISLMTLLAIILSVGIYTFRLINERRRAARLQALIDERTRELSLALKEVQLQKQQAELANKFKTELLGLAAHDLRNPLQTIQGFSALIKEEASKDSNIFELSEYVYLASSRMFNLINDLLETVHLESSELKFNLQYHDLSFLLEQLIKVHEPIAARKNQTFITSLDSSCYAFVDSRRFEQVIENLLSNSFKFSPPNTRIWISLEKQLSVNTKYPILESAYSSKNNLFSLPTKNSIPISPKPFSESVFLKPKIEPSLLPSDTIPKETEYVPDLAVITIRDEGLGMSETDLKKVFGKFQRLSSRPTAGESSSGLGLAIVKQLVDRQGGKISITSPGKGKGIVVSLSFQLQQSPIKATL